MRTITQRHQEVQGLVDLARHKDVRAELLRAAHGQENAETVIAHADAQAAIARASIGLMTALAEVPKVCRERIDMWSKVIARSTDDDEIRDAQAAQSELRWLLLQLEGEE